MLTFDPLAITTAIYVAGEEWCLVSVRVAGESRWVILPETESPLKSLFARDGSLKKGKLEMLRKVIEQCGRETGPTAELPFRQIGD